MRAGSGAVFFAPLELAPDVRLAGIDDLEYARLLPVPLTTYRQPTRQIGEVALGAMLERVARPELPTRDVLLHGKLVVRRPASRAARAHSLGRLRRLTHLPSLGRGPGSGA